MTNGKKKLADLSTEGDEDSIQKNWDNPKNPERAEDERDIEKLARQKKESDRRKDNLTTDENN